MRKLFVLLTFITFSVMAETAPRLSYNQDGQLRETPGCVGDFWWNGEACVKVKVIEDCKSQGGKWVYVQIGFPPDHLVRNRAFINTCLCPDEKVWDGEKCRSDVPLSKQCITPFDIHVRITEEVFGSENCPRAKQE